MQHIVQDRNTGYLRGSADDTMAPLDYNKNLEYDQGAGDSSLPRGEGHTGIFNSIRRDAQFHGHPRDSPHID